ncbi:MAG: hypothetical protein ACR2H3_00880 [Acidimicrobiales bacterium]
MKINRLAPQTMAVTIAGARPRICASIAGVERTTNGTGFGAYGTHVSNAMKRPEGLRGSPG